MKTLSEDFDPTRIGISDLRVRWSEREWDNSTDEERNTWGVSAGVAGRGRFRTLSINDMKRLTASKYL